MDSVEVPMKCVCEEKTGAELDLVTDCFRQLWMFREIPEPVVRKMHRLARRKRHATGDLLFREGDAAREMFLVKEGRVRLFKILDSGQEITLDIRKPGDVVGENMMTVEAVCPVNAAAMEATVTCGFRKETFRKVVMQHPEVALRVMENMGERIFWLTTQISSLCLSSIEDRVLQVLCGLARDHGVAHPLGMRIDISLTHEELGFIVGAHRVSITRALRGLREEGKVHKDGRFLVVADQEMAGGRGIGSF